MMITYPKYKISEDLRRKVNSPMLLCFRILGRLGFNCRQIGSILGVHTETVRYWKNPEKHKLFEKNRYNKLKIAGTPRKKSKEIMKKCLDRKRTLYPIYKQWLKEYCYNRINKVNKKKEEYVL